MWFGYFTISAVSYLAQIFEQSGHLLTLLHLIQVFVCVCMGKSTYNNVACLENDFLLLALICVEEIAAAIRPPITKKKK